MKWSKTKLIRKIKHSLLNSYSMKNVQLNKAVLGLALATALFGVDLGAEAANSIITKVNKGNTIVTDGNVHHIYADKLGIDVAINHFDRFELAANEIANMYYKTSAGSLIEVNNMLNFVNNRIDIAGTVNAIKGSKIGGNMYFVSPEGMLVSRSGVINAGSLNVVVPTKAEYEKNANKLFNGFSVLQKIQNKDIALNEQGTIVVQGKINAVNGIELRANSIKIQGDQAELRTGTLDYTDFVNIKNENGDIAVDSTLNGNLVIEKTGNGDILLLTEGNNSALEINEAKLLADGSQKLVANSMHVAGEIKAKETVELNGGSITTGGILQAKTVALKAEDTLNNIGTLEAEKDMTLAAGVAANNNGQINAGNDLHITAGQQINNNGIITVGNNAELSANGSVVNNRTIEAGNSLKIYAKDYLGSNGMLKSGSLMELESEGMVTINANLFAEGDIRISARDVNIYASIQADESADITAANDLVNTQEIVAGNNLNLAAAGNLTNSGALNAANDVKLEAGKTLSNNGPVNAGNNAELAAGLELNNSGSVLAGNDVSLVAEASLTNSGVISADGKAKLQAGKELVNNESITAGNDISIVAQDGGVVNRGKLISAHNISINSSGRICILADVKADGSINLDSVFSSVTSEGASTNVTIESVHDAVNIGAYEGVSLHNVYAEGGISLISSTGDVSVVKLESIGESVTVGADANISVQEIKANKAVGLTSTKGNISVNKVTADSVEYSASAGEVIIDFIFGPKDDGERNHPYHDLNYSSEYKRYEASIVSAMQDKDTFGDKLDDKVLVYYNRYDLYELEPMEAPTTTEDGTTVAGENSALILSVAEAAEHKEK